MEESSKLTVLILAAGVLSISGLSSSLDYSHYKKYLTNMERERGIEYALKEAELCSGPKDDFLYRVFGGLFDFGKWVACENYLEKRVPKILNSNK